MSVGPHTADHNLRAGPQGHTRLGAELQRAAANRVHWSEGTHLSEARYVVGVEFELRGRALRVGLERLGGRGPGRRGGGQKNGHWGRPAACT